MVWEGELGVFLIVPPPKISGQGAGGGGGNSHFCEFFLKVFSLFLKGGELAGGDFFMGVSYKPPKKAFSSFNSDGY